MFEKKKNKDTNSKDRHPPKFKKMRTPMSIAAKFTIFKIKECMPINR